MQYLRRDSLTFFNVHIKSKHFSSLFIWHLDIDNKTTPFNAIDHIEKKSGGAIWDFGNYLMQKSLKRLSISPEPCGESGSTLASAVLFPFRCYHYHSHSSKEAIYWLDHGSLHSPQTVRFAFHMVRGIKEKLKATNKELLSNSPSGVKRTSQPADVHFHGILMS